MRAAAQTSAVGIALINAISFTTSAGAQTSEPMPIGTFAMDEFEVTIAQFRAFVTAKGWKTAAEREGGGFEFVGGWVRRSGWSWAAPFGESGRDNEPAVHVSWTEARDYCAYVGGRLPTFDEWRRAAYTETREVPTDGFVKGRTYAYPVGDGPDGMNSANVGQPERVCDAMAGEHLCC